MLIGSHQLNFGPQLGYFHKMLMSDVFTINTFAKPDKDSARCALNRHGVMFYFNVPTLKASSLISTAIDCSRITKHQSWRHEQWARLEDAYHKSPLWKDESCDLYDVLVECQESNLIGYSTRTLLYLKGALGIDTPLRFEESERHGMSVTDRVVNAVKSCGGDSYISGKMFDSYYDRNEWLLSGLQRYTQVLIDPKPYSVIHYLLTVGRDKTRIMVEKCATLEKVNE